MGPHGYPMTGRDVMLAHWLATVPGHLRMVAHYGRWSAAEDALDERCGRFGAGRN